MRKLKALRGLFLGIVAGILFGLGGLEAIAYFKRPSPVQEMQRLIQENKHESYVF